MPDHPGLAYTTWGPVGADSKLEGEERDRWLGSLCDVTVAPDYAHSFKRWRGSFVAPGDRTFELALVSRLLLGHGNASATDVGITVHHTWGVPVIPGSALKGLLVHYVDAVYGPDQPDLRPWEQEEGERERAEFQGPTWSGRRVRRGPGRVHRMLFGAPEADEDEAMRTRAIDAGARGGAVTFHDALYVPAAERPDCPFAIDVLTVHHKTYYDSAGRSGPNDYDDPNPVAFVTVRPRSRMLFALSGPPDWTELAQRLLTEALGEWGVGGKTSSGYGRLVPPELSRAPTAAAPPRAAVSTRLPQSASTPAGLRPGDGVPAVLLQEKTKKDGWRARHEASGLAGPIHNTADVPPDKKPGDVVELIVASVNVREIAFRYPTGAERGASVPSSRGSKRPGGDRPRGGGRRW